MSKSQYNHLGAYGRAPRKGEPAWSCISGITAEGARVPSASRHIKYRGEPRILHGLTPLEAGRVATERADKAYDHGRRRRRLRRDGKVLLAGVVSYPVPRQAVESNPAETNMYLRWREMTLKFLIRGFGEHLLSAVEHADEAFLHIHYYVVPQLSSDGHLNLHEIHPGRRMKRDAAEAGACKKFQDAAYRSGMSRWQDDYWYAVSRNFGHDRYGPKRQRVIRIERKMERQMEEKSARQQAAFAAERNEFEQELSLRREDLDRENARVFGAWWEGYEMNFDKLRAACITLKERLGAERAARRSAESELLALRERLAELEPEVSVSIVA